MLPLDIVITRSVGVHTSIGVALKCRGRFVIRVGGVGDLTSIVISIDDYLFLDALYHFIMKILWRSVIYFQKTRYCEINPMPNSGS
jgi:hypothetical protein